MDKRLNYLKNALDADRDGLLIQFLKQKANTVRKDMFQMGYNSHIQLHYGAIMSIVEIAVLLYYHWLDIRSDDPGWSNRDRFVLSKGHGAPALYAILAEVGFFDKSELGNFRHYGSILQGHPDRLKTPGIECNSGSLGQGMPTACGMALSAKIDRAKWKVYCLIGDGECNEGSIWEAAMIASNQKLDRLIVLMDRNMKSSYGIMAGRNDIEPVQSKWQSFGWKVFEANGHDFCDLSQKLSEAENTKGQPSIIICHTLKGKGIPFIENYPAKPNILLTEEQFKECMDILEQQ